jgi:hypothetical protein
MDGRSSDRRTTGGGTRGRVSHREKACADRQRMGGHGQGTEDWLKGMARLRFVQAVSACTWQWRAGNVVVRFGERSPDTRAQRKENGGRRVSRACAWAHTAVARREAPVMDRVGFVDQVGGSAHEEEMISEFRYSISKQLKNRIKFGKMLRDLRKI